MCLAMKIFEQNRKKALKFYSSRVANRKTIDPIAHILRRENSPNYTIIKFKFLMDPSVWHRAP